MKYNYDVEHECFVREDGLGKKFYINITEAHRIMTMTSLGNSISEIRNKIKFANPRKVSESTIVNFIKNVNEGNIVLSDDYPAPVLDVLDMTTEERVIKLEERISALEEKIENNNVMSENDKKSFKDKVKSWI